MPATMLKNKVMYRQFFHSVAFFKLEILYMFKTFVSLLSGHASYFAKQSVTMPILSRSQWPRGLRRGSAAARLLELQV